MQCSLSTQEDLGRAERIHKWLALSSARLHSSKQIVSGERAMSVKRERKESISAQWHHSFGVEAQSFYSHVLSNWHIPRSQSAPPPPSFCPPFLLHHFSAKSSGVTQAESKERGARGRLGHGAVGTGRGFGKQSEKAEISRKSPDRLSPSDHICLLFSSGLYYLYFHCYDLDSFAYEEFQNVCSFYL